ncbi:MAG: polysaccharide deacetylase family protein [Flavobacteriales bacterium]|nr:polysaccharide deacetylase family protein [Flavobacteriales bacterium]
MIIYSALFSPRLEFIAELIFRELLGIKTRITTDADLYQQSEEPGLNYSTNAALRGLKIHPSGLLFENRISDQEPRWENSETGPELLFQREKRFDPLAASFYLVSRYEEYLPFEPDLHNRFPAEHSILIESDHLSKPLVNIWALELLEALKEMFPALQSNPRKFEYLSTIDIDQAWKYRNKGLKLTVGGLFRDLINGNTEELQERIKTLRGGPDPYDNFDTQFRWHAEYGTDAHYFLQVGKRGPYDKNQSAQNTEFQALIRSIEERAKIGLHPSYRSNKQTDLLDDEKQILERITGKRVKSSRQHYLMHRMPWTYEHLIDIGIETDYTMGYSTHMGFRMGLAAPCRFFNLKTNTVTPLRLVPFCLMDITPMHYMGLNLQNSMDEVKRQIEMVHRVGGLYCTLWHNESLSESGRWKGWSPLYRMILETCSELS